MITRKIDQYGELFIPVEHMKESAMVLYWRILQVFSFMSFLFMLNIGSYIRNFENNVLY